MLDVKRNALRELPIKERLTTFKETTFTYDDETAIKEAKRCHKCKNAPCAKGCPVGVDIPGFISKIACHDFDSAALILKSVNALPSICGRVCPQEEQCEKFCVKCKANREAVATGRLERFIGDYLLNKGNLPKASSVVSTKTSKIAVIGSGPASLSCANDCAMAGLDVTVFESLHSPGGVLTYGIPEFRLPKDLVNAEIESLKNIGVKIKVNYLIGKTLFFKELVEQYNAVFIGTGAGLPKFLGIEGEELNGVYSANEYLTRTNLMKAYSTNSQTPIVKHKNVIVLGGGNVAFDAARTALRLGTESTILAYRRGHNELRARHEEIVHAQQEGVQIKTLIAPVKIVSTDGVNVTSVEFVRSELSEPDSSGRRGFTLIPNSNFEIACDATIVAIGTNPNPLIKGGFDGLITDSRGCIPVDSNFKTNLDTVYAGGDATTGSATVISAMGAGKKAAASIIARFAN
ncbi:MAG: NADPH-dependent glutamate synthase [Christensenellaceae bacterium]|jgi:glutamate synthase (NADPH/NADH) small chain|nr:NADPH-dependent glutamate synthase [Christensenellaceae bacterium]